MYLAVMSNASTNVLTLIPYIRIIELGLCEDDLHALLKYGMMQKLCSAWPCMQFAYEAGQQSLCQTNGVSAWATCCEAFVKAGR